MPGVATLIGGLAGTVLLLGACASQTVEVIAPQPVQLPDRQADGATISPDPQSVAPSAPPVSNDDTNTVRLAFAGDSYAEGSLAYRLASQPDDFVGPFAKVFRNADLAMLNLEAAITTADTPEPKAYTFRTTREILPALSAGGIDAVSMANNHGMDYGWDGFSDSLAAKESSDSPVVLGIGENQESAYAPWVTAVKGQRIAFFAATSVLDDNLIDKWTAGPDKGGLASAKRVDLLTEAVASVRADVDTVVVFLHWGVEKMNCPTQDQVDLAEALQNAGADIIVGGHQHRLAGGGMMGDAYVHYGLGNFLFAPATPGAEKTGALTVDVRGREIIDATWHPGRIIDSVPQRLFGADRAQELAYWKALRKCADLDPVK